MAASGVLCLVQLFYLHILLGMNFVYKICMELFCKLHFVDIKNQFCDRICFSLRYFPNYFYLSKDKSNK